MLASLGGIAADRVTPPEPVNLDPVTVGAVALREALSRVKEHLGDPVRFDEPRLRFTLLIAPVTEALTWTRSLHELAERRLGGAGTFYENADRDARGRLLRGLKRVRNVAVHDLHSVVGVAMAPIRLPRDWQSRPTEVRTHNVESVEGVAAGTVDLLLVDLGNGLIPIATRANAREPWRRETPSRPEVRWCRESDLPPPKPGKYVALERDAYVRYLEGRRLPTTLRIASAYLEERLAKSPG